MDKQHSYYFGNKVYLIEEFLEKDLKEIRDLYSKYVYCKDELRNATAYLKMYYSKGDGTNYKMYEKRVSDIKEVIQLIEERVEKLHQQNIRSNVQKPTQYSNRIHENLTEVKWPKEEKESSILHKLFDKRESVSLFFAAVYFILFIFDIFQGMSWFLFLYDCGFLSFFLYASKNIWLDWIMVEVEEPKIEEVEEMKEKA